MIVAAPFDGLTIKSTRTTEGWQGWRADIDIDQVGGNL
jgi:hypothetical protein